MSELYASPSFGIALTVLVYWVGVKIQKKTGLVICNNMIIAVALLIALHLFNLAINTLGAFVHCARLQYVEFYGKFYETGGTMFKPLGYNTRHVRLTDKAS